MEVSYFEIDVASGIFVELAGISAVFAIHHWARDIHTVMSVRSWSFFLDGS